MLLELNTHCARCDGCVCSAEGLIWFAEFMNQVENTKKLSKVVDTKSIIATTRQLGTADLLYYHIHVNFRVHL